MTRLRASFAAAWLACAFFLGACSQRAEPQPLSAASDWLALVQRAQQLRAVGAQLAIVALRRGRVLLARCSALAQQIGLCCHQARARSRQLSRVRAPCFL